MFRLVAGRRVAWTESLGDYLSFTDYFMLLCVSQDIIFSAVVVYWARTFKKPGLLKVTIWDSASAIVGYSTNVSSSFNFSTIAIESYLNLVCSERH